jgi:hypothetical protein
MNLGNKRVILFIVSLVLLQLIIIFPKTFETIPQLGPPAHCDRYTCSAWENTGCGVSICGELEVMQTRSCDHKKGDYGDIIRFKKETEPLLSMPTECTHQCVPRPEICNSPPSVPSIISPQDLVNDTPINVTLYWESSDTNNHILIYDIHFGENPVPGLILENHTNKNYSLTNLEYSTIYYWKIIAKDEYDETEGSIWQFTTQDTPIINSPPSIPTLLSPANNSINTSINITLSWSSTDPDGDNITYDLYFNNSLILDKVSQTNYNLINLSYNTPYNWNVISRDHEFSISGPIWTFTTGLENKTENQTNQTSYHGPGNGEDRPSNRGTTQSALFDIKVFLEEDSSEFNPGDAVKASIVLYNFGTLRPVDVFLECSLEDMELNKIDYFTETLAVEMQTSIVRELGIPKDAQLGNYVYSCYMIYGTETVTSSDLVRVVEKIDPHEEMPFTTSIEIFLFLAVIIILATITITFIKKKKKSFKWKLKL